MPYMRALAMFRKVFRRHNETIGICVAKTGLAASVYRMDFQETLDDMTCQLGEELTQGKFTSPSGSTFIACEAGSRTSHSGSSI